VGVQPRPEGAVMSALLTSRRTIDHARVASALCPAA
jgi:hypothetical protein